jgi:hypothetical protein
MASSGDEKKPEAPEEASRVVQFHHSRVAPPRSKDARELGVTLLAQQLRLETEHLTGHWCSRCVGIWYGTALEVECPVCGGRRG